jgi:cellulose synthase/poly-beta-1,6-N-acetylglucosamine synthase-like glycosyltransferase
MEKDQYWQSYAMRFVTYGDLRKNNIVLPVLMSICIPSYAEPALLKTLASLLQCDMPAVEIEVLILFNEDDRMNEDERKIHHQSYQIACVG